MAIEIDARRLGALTVLGAALASGGCAMMESQGGRYSPMPPGSSYVRVERNTGSLGNGTREISTTVAEQAWNGMDVIALRSSIGGWLVSRDGRTVAFLDPAGNIALKWDPPDQGPGMRFPLEVGKTWSESARMTNAKNEVIPHENRCRVEAKEETKVPAGTFMTFKVHCSSPRGLEITHWFSPAHGIDVKQVWSRAANNPFGGAGTRVSEVISLDVKR